MTCLIWGIDSLGLDRVARDYLRFLADAGGTLRLNVLASKLDGLAKTTVERKIEPDLVFLGLIEKQPNGRTITAAGREHLNREGH
jgi:Holliday junction DNA helicase RuvB